MRAEAAALFLAFASHAIAQSTDTAVTADTTAVDTSAATDAVTIDSTAVDTLTLDTMTPDSSVTIDFPPTTLTGYPTGTDMSVGDLTSTEEYTSYATDDVSSEFYPGTSSSWNAVGGSSSPIGSAMASSNVPVSYTTTTSYEECEK